MAKNPLENMSVDRDCPHCKGKEKHSRKQRKACKKNKGKGAR